MIFWGSGVRSAVVKNTIFQLAVQAVSISTGMISNMVLSRSLGVEGFGMYNYIFAFYAIFLSLNDFGINMILIREVSKNREKAGEIMGSVLLFKLFVSGVCMVIAWIAIAFSPMAPELKKSLYLYAWVMPILILQLPLMIFQIDLKMGCPMVLGILNRLFQFALVMLAVYLKGSVTWLIAALLLADALFIPAYWWVTKPHLKLVLRFDKKTILKILKSSVPLGVAGIVGMFVTQVNTLFLERLSNLHEVGIYAAAFRMTSPFLMIPPLIMNTVYPLMSRYAAGDIPRLRRLYKECLLYFSLAGFLLAGGVILLSPWITRIIFGELFASSSLVLNIMMGSIAAVYFGITSGNFLISIGKERANIYILGAGAVVNTFLIVSLTPQWGALGAAMAMGGSFLVIVSSSLVLSEYYFFKLRNESQAVKCIFLNAPSGRSQNLKNAVIRCGWEVEEWDCVSWATAFRQILPFFRSLRGSAFLVAGMNFPFQGPWILLAQMMRVKVVLDCPVDVTESPFASSWLWKKMIGFFCRNADYFLTLKSRGYMVKKFNIHPAHVFYIENCPDAERIQRSLKASPAFSLPPGALRICYSGVADWHGPERFGAVFKLLKDKIPGLQWDVISDFETPSMKRLVENCEKENILSYLQRHPVIKPYERFISTVNQFQLWVSHLDNESILARYELRTELLEMGLLGKAVIAVPTPAMEMHGFKDGENIIYIDPNSPAESAEKIAEYFKSPEKIQRIGCELRRHVAKNFSIDEKVKDFLKFMKVSAA